VAQIMRNFFFPGKERPKIALQIQPKENNHPVGENLTQSGHPARQVSVMALHEIQVFECSTP
jgi:hypothetical protein